MWLAQNSAVRFFIGWSGRATGQTGRWSGGSHEIAGSVRLSLPLLSRKERPLAVPPSVHQVSFTPPPTSPGINCTLPPATSPHRCDCAVPYSSQTTRLVCCPVPAHKFPTSTPVRPPASSYATLIATCLHPPRPLYLPECDTAKPTTRQSL